MRTASAMLCLALLAGCTITGRRFDPHALSQIQPGYTTLAQAIELLGAEPQNIYRRVDGSATAFWSYKASMVTDAVYLRQDLLLAFGADGRFERVVDSVNILSQPAQPNGMATVAGAAASSDHRASALPTTIAPQRVERPINEPAVSYPLSP